MKKLLGLMGSITLISSTGSAVLGCSNQGGDNEKNMQLSFIDDKSIIDLEKLFVEGKISKGKVIEETIDDPSWFVVNGEGQQDYDKIKVLFKETKEHSNTIEDINIFLINAKKDATNITLSNVKVSISEDKGVDYKVLNKLDLKLTQTEDDSKKNLVDHIKDTNLGPFGISENSKISENQLLSKINSINNLNLTSDDIDFDNITENGALVRGKGDYVGSVAIVFQCFKILNLDSSENYLGFIEGFNKDATQQSLTDNEKNQLKKIFLQKNDIDDGNFDKYTDFIEIEDFKKIEDNRTFTLRANDGSEFVNGYIEEVTFLVEKIDLSSGAINNGGTNIDGIEEEEKNDKTKVENSILNHFIENNSEHFRFSIKDIEIKSKSAKNPAPENGQRYFVIIKSKEGQNNVNGEANFYIQAFKNGSFTVDVEKLFN